MLPYGIKLYIFVAIRHEPATKRQLNAILIFLMRYSVYISALHTKKGEFVYDMGTVKLHNIKNRSHLKAAIAYIFKDKKTASGKYIFGDSGYDPDMVYDTFMDTKRLFDKTDGRQAYHYILTFAEEDDVSGERAREITEKFVIDTFGGEYDWAAAVHNDTGHTHAHIIFNSVSRTTGMKYRYKQGDWQKKIQKTADRLCSEYGLATIAYDIDGNLKEHMTDRSQRNAENHEKHNVKRRRRADVIRQDIDRCILDASDFGSFIELMKKDGYYIRQGHSEKYGAYLSFKVYGDEKAVRSYRLGRGYQLSDIKLRLEKESVQNLSSDVNDQREERVKRISEMPAETQSRYYVKNIYIARVWRNEFVFPGSYRYKKSIIEYEQLDAEWRLFNKMKFKSPEDIEVFLEEIKYDIKDLYKKKAETVSAEEYEEIGSEVSRLYFNKKTAEKIKQRMEKLEKVSDSRNKTETNQLSQ